MTQANCLNVYTWQGVLLFSEFHRRSLSVQLWILLAQVKKCLKLIVLTLNPIKKSIMTFKLHWPQANFVPKWKACSKRKHSTIVDKCSSLHLKFASRLFRTSLKIKCKTLLILAAKLPVAIKVRIHEFPLITRLHWHHMTWRCFSKVIHFEKLYSY